MPDNVMKLLSMIRSGLGGCHVCKKLPTGTTLDKLNQRRNRAWGDFSPWRTVQTWGWEEKLQLGRILDKANERKNRAWGDFSCWRIVHIQWWEEKLQLGKTLNKANKGRKRTWAEFSCWRKILLDDEKKPPARSRHWFSIISKEMSSTVCPAKKIPLKSNKTTNNPGKLLHGWSKTSSIQNCCWCTLPSIPLHKIHKTHMETETANKNFRSAAAAATRVPYKTCKSHLHINLSTSRELCWITKPARWENFQSFHLFFK